MFGTSSTKAAVQKRCHDDKDVVSVHVFLQDFLHKIKGMTYLTIVDVQELILILIAMEMHHLEYGNHAKIAK